ncbi:hypothetical protein [Clostridium sp. Marseille-QA1073]
MKLLLFKACLNKLSSNLIIKYLFREVDDLDIQRSGYIMKMD